MTLEACAQSGCIVGRITFAPQTFVLRSNPREFFDHAPQGALGGLGGQVSHIRKPMDAKTLQARLDIARSFKHSVGHIEFRCRLIPQSRMAGIYERNRGSNMDAAMDILGRTVLGMKGALSSDLNLEGEEPIEDSIESALMLLEERQDIAIALASEIAKRIAARSKDIGEEEKNFSSGSAST